jgi:hypothetical protein
MASRLKRPPVKHEREVVSVAFHPNGAEALTGSTIRPWQTPSPLDSRRDWYKYWVGWLMGREMHDLGSFACSTTRPG